MLRYYRYGFNGVFLYGQYWTPTKRERYTSDNYKKDPIWFNTNQHYLTKGKRVQMARVRPHTARVQLQMATELVQTATDQDQASFKTIKEFPISKARYRFN